MNATSVPKPPDAADFAAMGLLPHNPFADTEAVAPIASEVELGVPEHEEKEPVGEGAETAPKASTKDSNPFRGAYRQLSPEDLLTDPPPPNFILRPYIPAGAVSVLSGPGGSNKTTLTMHLAVCRALGLRFFGGEQPTEGETVIVTTEDRIEDYLRKLAALRVDLGTAFDAAKVARKIHFFDLSGVPCRMVRAESGQYAPTPMPDQLAETIAERAPMADHVVMETISRLTGGVETNESLSILVESAQRVCRLRESVGLAVTLVGHVGQEAGRNGVADAYASRGGSALGDNGRSSMVLQKITAQTRKDYAPDCEVSPEQLKRLRVLTHPKSNGALGAGPVLLECSGNRNGAILLPAVLNRRGEVNASGERVASLVRLIKRLGAQGQNVTESILRAYTGLRNELGFPKGNLPAVINEAVAAGLIFEAANGARGGGVRYLLTAIEGEGNAGAKQ